MYRSALPPDEPIAEMNFIPLIDIALTLVIILMVTTAFIQHPGFSLKLPETKTREGAPENNRDLVVGIAADGALFLDGQARTEAEVGTALREAAARDKTRRVLVKGDRAAVYARVMQVMDLVRQAGPTRVVLPTEPKRAETTPTLTPNVSAPLPLAAPAAPAAPPSPTATAPTRTTTTATP